MGGRLQSKMRLIVASLVLLSVAFALPAQRAYDMTGRTLMEEQAPPQQWAMEGPPQPEDKLQLYVFLKHPEGAEETLERTLAAVSDPRSPDYGKHMTLPQLRSLLFAPEHHSVVNSWFQEHNVTEVEPTEIGDMISIKVNSAQAEVMFATPLHRFVREGREPVVR